jgi:hypothetical protein
VPEATSRSSAARQEKYREEGEGSGVCSGRINEEQKKETNEAKNAKKRKKKDRKVQVEGE